VRPSWGVLLPRRRPGRVAVVRHRRAGDLGDRPVQSAGHDAAMVGQRPRNDRPRRPRSGAHLRPGFGVRPPLGRRCGALRAVNAELKLRAMYVNSEVRIDLGLSGHTTAIVYPPDENARHAATNATLVL